jgi:hypothetical protein
MGAESSPVDSKSPAMSVTLSTEHNDVMEVMRQPAALNGEHLSRTFLTRQCPGHDVIVHNKAGENYF